MDIIRSASIEENIHSILKFEYLSLVTTVSFNNDIEMKEKLLQYSQNTDNKDIFTCIQCYISLSERVSKFRRSAQTQESEAKLIGFLIKKLIEENKSTACHKFTLTCRAIILSQFKTKTFIHQHLLNDKEEITSTINSLARQALDTIPYNYFILSQNSNTREEKIKLLIDGVHAGSDVCLMALTHKQIQDPEFIQSLLCGLEINYTRARQILSELASIYCADLYYDMLKYGIGGPKLSSEEIYNESIKMEVKIRTAVSINSIEDNTEIVKNLILTIKLILNILSEGIQVRKYEAILREKINLTVETRDKNDCTSATDLFKTLHFLALGFTYLKDYTEAHKRFALVTSLLRSHPRLIEEEPKLAKTHYASYSKLLSNKQATTKARLNRRAELYLRKAKALGYEETKQEIKDPSKPSKNARRKRKACLTMRDEIKAKQAKAGEKKEEPTIVQKPTSSKNISVDRPLWVDYAIASEQRVSAKKEAMELAKQKDEVAERKRSLKAAKKRPEVEIKEEDIILDDVNIPYRISINKKNREVLLSILSFESNCKKEIELVSKGATTLTRKDILDLIDELNGTSGQGKGSHEGGKISRIDLNAKATKTEEVAASLSGPASYTAIFPKDKEVKQAYIRRLANELLALGYNKETVTEKRNIHEEVSTII